MLEKQTAPSIRLQVRSVATTSTQTQPTKDPFEELFTERTRIVAESDLSNVAGDLVTGAVNVVHQLAFLPIDDADDRLIEAIAARVEAKAQQGRPLRPKPR